MSPIAPDPPVLGIALATASAFYGAALVSRDLVRAVISFALGSAALAAAFATLGAPFAAVLELTVGAGLIAVLFLVAITLTERPGAGHA